MKNPLGPDELTSITSKTLRHYEANAQSFWVGTKDHDVSQNYDALLSALPLTKGMKILDFGCGPGRDLIYFKAQGHHPVGLDGSREFCEMARAKSGCEVLHQDFLSLDLPPAAFDGIFANASLFHVPRQELGRVLKELRAALASGGILFSSNPRGRDEGWSGERYGNYMEFAVYQEFLENAGFEPLDHYYRPAGLPNSQQPWLAVVSKARPNLT